jgi:hypothetical protein
MRAKILIVILALTVVATASAISASRLITVTSIGKGKLGQTRAKYRSAYGKQIRADNIDPNMVRVVYPNRVDVYFKGGGNKGRYIVVASADYYTAKHVGPCTPAASVKSAYPSAVKVKLAGKEYAYRIGGSKLWFEIEGKNVAAVALGADKQAAWIASNTAPCYNPSP